MLAALPRPEKSTIVRLRPLPIPGWLRSAFGFVGRLAPGLAATAAARIFFTPTRARRRPEQEEILARGRRFELESDAGPVVGWSWGAGAPVLLLHGWSGHAGQLAPFVEPLVERGRRVVALDLPAHGASAGTRTNIRLFAAAIRRAGEIFGPFEAVVAHSFGCAATTLAMDSGFVARRVVFLAPPSRFESFVARMVEGLGLVLPVESRFRRAIQEWVGERFEEIEPRLLARHQDAELLVFHDRDDDEVRFEEGEELVTRWPGARLTTTAGLGHYRILRDRQVITEAVRFVVAPGTREMAVEA